jgi:hypothetical protein
MYAVVIALLYSVEMINKLKNDDKKVREFSTGPSSILGSAAQGSFPH